MANIDYQEAKKEIEKIFRTDGASRKIVFWYDAPANFKEDIEADSFEFCRLLVCHNNEFAIKKIIEKDDTTSNILVYIPYEKPRDSENWLLDILLYSDEYYADTVALTMRHLGLTNPDLRNVIENHAKFFDSAQRNKRLDNYVVVNDEMTTTNFMLAMMSVLVKTPASVRSIEAILTELVFDNSDKAKYKELCKYGFEDYLWDEIAKEFNYSGDQKIEALIKKFMFTAMLGQDVQLGTLPSFYDQYIIEDEGKNGAKSFVHHIKQDARYRDLQFNIATDLKIDGLLAVRDVNCIGTSDIFECIDEYAVKKISEGLVSGSLDYEAFIKVINGRNNSIWWSNHKDEYGFLRSAIEFFKLLEKPIEFDLPAVEYIRQYVDSYYKVDFYYRHACTSIEKIENPIEEMVKLSYRLEHYYEQSYLDILGREYSKAISKLSKWEFSGIQKSSYFYQLIQRQQYKKLFVIISDGLRYEVGQEISEEIKNDAALRGKVSLDYAVSPLPSETRFGMASLLPHKELSYSKGSVLVDGKPSNSIAARNDILKAKNAGYAAISYEEINHYSRDELRKYMADKSLVYIFHNVIDNAGEHNESRVFAETPKAIEEICALVKKLYNHLQISNYYITGDHGFLYRTNTIYESQKYSNVVSQNPVEASKRYVLTDDENVNIPYTTSFAIDEVKDGLKVINPFGYDLFKTQGAGIQYVHGGTSLQETIVPIIHISELNAKKGEKLSRPVGVRLKSVVRKITNRSFTLDFEQYEKVEDKIQAINCETYFVDENGTKVSGEYRFIANSNSDDASTRVTRIRFTLKNIEFNRNNRYYLILRNADADDEYIEREQFTIDILGFRTF